MIMRAFRIFVPVKRARLSASGLVSPHPGLARPRRARRGALAPPPLCRDIYVVKSSSISLPLCCRLLARLLTSSPLLPTIADRLASILQEAIRQLLSHGSIALDLAPPGHAYSGPRTRAFDRAASPHSLPSAPIPSCPSARTEMMPFWGGLKASVGSTLPLCTLLPLPRSADRLFHHCSADRHLSSRVVSTFNGVGRLCKRLNIILHSALNNKNSVFLLMLEYISVGYAPW
jgi:hypothetical protein